MRVNLVYIKLWSLATKIRFWSKPCLIQKSTMPKTKDSFLRKVGAKVGWIIYWRNYVKLYRVTCCRWFCVCLQLKFLEVSHLSFVAGLGAKLKEGMVEKRAGGRRVALHCCFCCTCCQLGHWQKRWGGWVMCVWWLFRPFHWIRTRHCITVWQTRLQLANYNNYLYHIIEFLILNCYQSSLWHVLNELWFVKLIVVADGTLC